MLVFLTQNTKPFRPVVLLHLHSDSTRFSSVDRHTLLGPGQHLLKDRVDGQPTSSAYISRIRRPRSHKTSSDCRHPCNGLTWADGIKTSCDSSRRRHLNPLNTRTPSASRNMEA